MYKKVLFTTDGSRFAEDSLPYAIDLAKQCGAQLEVMTVVENPVFYGTPEATALYDAEFYRSLASELDKLATSAVERGAAGATAAGMKATTRIRRGSPADEIVSEAKEWGADVIVLSTHGRTGLGRLFLGSVANSLVHHAPCPVLLHRVSKED
jgi:nucleotide-binding universal stress UspA family protein